MASRPRRSMGIINLVPHPGSIRPDCLDEPVRNHSLEEPITQNPFSRGFWVIGFILNDIREKAFALPRSNRKIT